MTTTETFDHIIVGAGSAGCVLANRLSHDPARRILLLEAGGTDRSPIIKIPLTWGLILKHRLFDWGYFTQPEPGMDNRTIECARGKVLGGCSSINGMAYARGLPDDYDHWATNLGLPTWSYAHTIPYFKRAETWEAGETDQRGGDGPLTVQTLHVDDPLVDAFLAATQTAGYPQSPDYNAQQPGTNNAEGFGPMQTTIRRGLRHSAATAYLRPALRRPNLTLRIHAHVTRILFNGTRAIGVEYRRNGQLHQAHATHETILSGGVVNSPQLLMLSGIGDPAALAQHGIPVTAPLPGVGQNLHDHIVCDVRWRRHTPGPLHDGLRLDRIALSLLRTLTTGKGLSAQIPAAAVGLVRSQPHLPLPDTQLILAAGPMNAAPHLAPLLPAYVDAFAIKGIMLQPESRGTITLASPDPTAAPLIHQNFLSTEPDRTAAREMVRRMRDIGAQPTLQPFIAEELAPGPQNTTNEAIDAFIRQTAITLHHPCGTCQMGPASNPQAVLDPQMRVYGTQNLRVVDGSAIPQIPRGPINAPIIMMAERIAEDLAT